MALVSRHLRSRASRSIKTLIQLSIPGPDSARIENHHKAERNFMAPQISFIVTPCSMPVTPLRPPNIGTADLLRELSCQPSPQQEDNILLALDKDATISRPLSSQRAGRHNQRKRPNPTNHYFVSGRVFHDYKQRKSVLDWIFTRTQDGLKLRSRWNDVARGRDKYFVLRA